MHRLSSLVAACCVSAVTLLVAADTAQQDAILPVDAVRPGMVGVSRTVFAGEKLEDFKVNILGTLRNAIGPGRHLIVARLEGGPLATTGVIAGMSGSPVYVDGKLVGAVSYALGSFPKEPIAGITPIEDMIRAVDEPGPRVGTSDLALPPHATPSQVFDTLKHLVERATAPLAARGSSWDINGPASLTALASGLRPIGVAISMGGIEPGIRDDLRRALALAPTGGDVPRQTPAARSARLRPGDPVGASLVRGDFELGATGTVTEVRGNRVYAFGHPFLNLGTTSIAMTSANVIAVLPSYDSSMKIASMGDVIGTLSQDRAVAIGGTLGAGPRELKISLKMTSDHGPDRAFTFYVLQDQTLTPLFSYVAVLNALSAYERQVGALSVQASGTVSFGTDGQIAIDEFFTGSNSGGMLATAATAPINVMAGNEFRTVLPQSLDLTLHTSEKEASSTIERAWLDTTRPELGGTHRLQVLLRDYRGGTEIVTMPVTMPAQATGNLTLLVCDGATLAGLEQRELAPARPTSFAGLVSQLNQSRHGNRLYVRVIANAPGVSVGGRNLPALPASAQSLLDADASSAAAQLSRTIVGAWEQRFDRAIRGARELTLTLTSKR